MRSTQLGCARVVVTAALLFALHGAHAQQARSGGSPANAQLQMQLQQLGSEKTRLDAENAKLKKDLDDALKKLDSLKSEQKALDSKAKASTAALEQSRLQSGSAEEQLRQTKEKFDQLVGKFRETAQTLRDTENDRTALKQSLVVSEQGLQTCADRNVQLYHLNDEVITYLAKQGFWSRAAASEPFTRLKRIENENLADAYKVKADEQRVASPTPTSAEAPKN